MEYRQINQNLVPKISISTYISDNNNKKKFINLINDYSIFLKEKIKTHSKRSGKENCNPEQNGCKKNY